jgi:hypothetical protein
MMLALLVSSAHHFLLEIVKSFPFLFTIQLSQTKFWPLTDLSQKFS